MTQLLFEPAVFVDQEGTLVKDRGLLTEGKDLTFLPETID